MKLSPGEGVYPLLIIMIMFCVTTLIMGTHFHAPLLLLIMVCVLECVYFLYHLVAVGRTIYLDEDGCIVTFGKYQKRYKWEEFIVKRVELYRGTEYRYSVYNKVKIVVLSPHKIYRYHKTYKKGQWTAPAYCAARYPFSMVYIYMISERNLKKAQLDKKVCDLSGYEVEEDMFLQKLKEWNIELEDLT